MPAPPSCGHSGAFIARQASPEAFAGTPPTSHPPLPNTFSSVRQGERGTRRRLLIVMLSCYCWLYRVIVVLFTLRLPHCGFSGLALAQNTDSHGINKHTHTECVHNRAHKHLASHAHTQTHLFVPSTASHRYMI